MLPEQPGFLSRIFKKEIFREILTRRIFVILVVFAIEAALFFVVSNRPLSPGTYQSYSQTLNSTSGSLHSEAPPVQVFSIFYNNIEIALGMFAPVYGQLTFVVSLYNTAESIEVIAIQSGSTPTGIVLELYSLPHTWLETSGYAVATTQGVYIILALVGGSRKFAMDRLERELGYVPISLALVASILIVAATFEVAEAQVVVSAQPLFWLLFGLLAALVIVVLRSLFSTEHGGTQPQA